MVGNRALVIAVDGPAASGKGTIAEGLASAFSLPYLDTGLLYRAAAARTMRLGLDLSNGGEVARAAREIDPQGLSAEAHALRTAEVGAAASRIAALPEVRAALLSLQTDFARRPQGAVLDGRDIGTVIAPFAPAKLFVTAAPEVRAHRRHLQHQARGEALTLDQVLADILARDARDCGRADAPLIPASDAVLLDTTHLSIEAAADAARRIVDTALAKGF